MKKTTLLVLLVLVVTFTQASFPQEEGSGEPSLGEQLEGLGPDARIAYLRYLVRSDSLNADVYFHMGVAYQEKGLSDTAMVYYRKAFELDPKMAKALVNMGVIYDGKHMVAQAINMFEKAAKLNPSDYLAHSHAAFLWFKLGNYKMASKHISKALLSAPDEAQPHFYLGVFFWESGIYREALLEWQKVVELDREGPLAREASKNIALIQRVMSGGIGEEGNTF